MHTPGCKVCPYSHYQCCCGRADVKSCLILSGPMDCDTPGFPGPSATKCWVLVLDQVFLQGSCYICFINWSKEQKPGAGCRYRHWGTKVNHPPKITQVSKFGWTEMETVCLLEPCSYLLYHTMSVQPWVSLFGESMGIPVLPPQTSSSLLSASQYTHKT